jgi:hypothetical protein
VHTWDRINLGPESHTGLKDVRNDISSWKKFTGTDWPIPSNPADELRMLLQTKFISQTLQKKKKKINDNSTPLHLSPQTDAF